MLAALPIIWFCDNQATRSFLDGSPPQNPRLRRWYTFLTLFRLTIKQIPGIKNEMCDWLSRSHFDSLTGQDFDQLAQDAFDQMDTALDFAIINKISDILTFSGLDHSKTEWSETWQSLAAYQSKLIDGKMFYRTTSELFCETKKVVPKTMLQKVLGWCHDVNGHPGPERTVLLFLQQFFVEISKRALIEEVKPLFERCEICQKSKPNSAKIAVWLVPCPFHSWPMTLSILISSLWMIETTTTMY